jgi:hypothetical protein
MFVLLYVVYAFLHRKAWQFSAKLGASSNQLAQLFEYGQERAQIDFANSIINQVKFNDAQQGQKQCPQSASSVLHQQRAVDTNIIAMALQRL